MVWIEAQHLEKEDGGGYLLFLEDAGRAGAIERSLRQAASHRCLMSLSRDTAHSLKDTLNAVLMYVELMAGAVKNGALPVAQTRHATRCADVVRRELRRLDRSLDERQRHVTARALTSDLGPYVTRAVVEAHGATLLDEPSLGGGRCVIVENLPLA